MAPRPSPQRLRKYHEHLLLLRALHAGDIEDLEADAFSDENARFTIDNPADTGSDSFSQTFSLELLRRDAAILRDIEDALARLREDTFGKCEGCGKWIQKARLDEVPFARLCIACQRKTEGAR